MLGVQHERRVHRTHPRRGRRFADATGAGSGRRRSRRRTRRRSVHRSSRSDTSTAACCRARRSADRRCRVRARATGRVRAPRSRARTRRSASRPSDGTTRVAPRALCEPGPAGRGARSAWRDKRRARRAWVIARARASGRSPRTRRPRPLRGCHSRDSAGRCRCGRPCRARCCLRRHRRVRRISFSVAVCGVITVLSILIVPRSTHNALCPLAGAKKAAALAGRGFGLDALARRAIARTARRARPCRTSRRTASCRRRT